MQTCPQVSKRALPSRYTPLTQRHTGSSDFLGRPCLQPLVISGTTLIFVSSSPSHSLAIPLPYPRGHLYSSTFIYCHPASVTACSDSLSHLARRSSSFLPSLPSVPHFWPPPLPPSHFLSSWQAACSAAHKITTITALQNKHNWTWDVCTRVVIQRHAHSHARF